MDKPKEFSKDYYNDVITPLREMDLCKEMLYVLIDLMCDTLVKETNNYYDKRQVLFRHIGQIIFNKKI